MFFFLFLDHVMKNMLICTYKEVVMIKIRKSWYEMLKPEFDKQYFKDLQEFLAKEYAERTIYPKEENIFNALNYTSYENVKVVIIGQDPYHEPNQAQGLSFSVPEDVEIPPSLVNIMKEIHDDLGIDCIPHGDLSRWAKQGVLLLNTTLTVRRAQANSHRGHGWEKFTGEIINILTKREKPMVFILWGANAQAFADRIPNNHLVLKAPHPSPLSSYRGFFGCKHFSKCNDFLIKTGQEPIDWH